MKTAELNKGTVLIERYVQEAMAKGILPSLVTKELLDMGTDRKTINAAFKASQKAAKMPKRISDDEIIRPLVDYLKFMRKYGDIDRKQLAAQAKKAGWSPKEFSKAIRKRK